MLRLQARDVCADRDRIALEPRIGRAGHGCAVRDGRPVFELAAQDEAPFGVHRRVQRRMTGRFDGRLLGLHRRRQQFGELPQTSFERFTASAFGRNESHRIADEDVTRPLVDGDLVATAKDFQFVAEHAGAELLEFVAEFVVDGHFEVVFFGFTTADEDPAGAPIHGHRARRSGAEHGRADQFSSHIHEFDHAVVFPVRDEEVAILVQSDRHRPVHGRHGWTRGAVDGVEQFATVAVLDYFAFPTGKDRVFEFARAFRNEEMAFGPEGRIAVRFGGEEGRGAFLPDGKYFSIRLEVAFRA